MKYISLLTAFVIGFTLAHAQGSKVYDDLSLKSKILGMDRKYAIYLPPGYETSQRNYPVLYLLHGGGDDQTGWVQFGEVQLITDKSIAEGGATPMIIVMPDANTGKRGYANNANNSWRYEDFFFLEFIPFIEKTYHIKADKHYRAVAGLSMGGDGSFTYALHHPELFSSACPLSAGTGPLTMEVAKTRWTKEIPGIADQDVTAWFNRQSVLTLVNNMPDTLKKSVRWYIDCGDDDFLYEGNSLVHIAMRKKEIPHEFRTRDGAHNWTYWRTALPTVLEFVSQAFHQY
ncbi:MAG: alpha/beta hydrolase-fold protein [Chitinophagaceae bacterium]